MSSKRYPFSGISTRSESFVRSGRLASTQAQTYTWPRVSEEMAVPSLLSDRHNYSEG